MKLVYLEGLEIIGAGNQVMESVGFVWRLRLIDYEQVVLRSYENQKNEELQINIKLDVKSNCMSRDHTKRRIIRMLNDEQTTP